MFISDSTYSQVLAQLNLPPSSLSLSDEKGDLEKAFKPWELVPANHHIGSPTPLFAEMVSLLQVVDARSAFIIPLSLLMMLSSFYSAPSVLVTIHIHSLLASDRRGQSHICYFSLL